MTLEISELGEIFEELPDAYLILNRNFIIMDVNQAYLKITRTQKNDILGHPIFDALPVNRDAHDGLEDLKNSLIRVLETKSPDTMLVQKYNIQNPFVKGGGYEERYWSTLHSPILGEDKNVKYIIHRVQDITEMVTLKLLNIEAGAVKEQLLTQQDKLTAEIYSRTEKVNEGNKKLQMAYDQLKKIEMNSSRLAAIIENTDDAVVTKNLDGIIQTWNKGAEKLYGYTAEEMIGKSIEILFRDPKDYTKILKQLKNGERMLFSESERKHKDGHFIPVSVNISPIRNANNEIIGACSIARDITEWKIAKALEARNKELSRIAYFAKESNKIKNQFIANVSHELRTPLNGIIGFSEMLYDGAVDFASKQHLVFLDHILTSAHHLLILIDDILDVTKIEAGKIAFHPEVINLRKLLNDIKKNFIKILNEKNIDIKVEIAPDLKNKIYLDPDKLKQVFNNYISNAIKFTPTDGKICIRVKPNDTEKFKLEVEDSGIGIQKKDLKYLFREFSQIDSSSTKQFAGNGLGLALSKKLVEAQGGSVGVQSKYGKGSRFYAILPYQYQTEALNLNQKIMESNQLEKSHV